MSGTVAAPLLVWAGVVGVLGTLVGSFLNVVVHRVPAGISVVRPGSACPVCGHAVRGRDNIPVVSWLLLRGRCRDCQAAIPVRYPLVEAGTGLLFATVALRLDDASNPLVLAAWLAVAAASVALALIDLAHGRLPFSITGVTAVLVVVMLAAGRLAGDVPLVAVVGGAALWLAVYGGLWLGTAGRGMGLGDVALAPVLGAALGAIGLAPTVVGLAAGFVLGAVVAVGLVLLGRVRRGTRVPHGPFMVLGAGVGLFTGVPLAAGYLSMVGIS